MGRIFFQSEKESLELKAVRTSFRSSWKNGVAERWVGSCRRDLLDHIIPVNERHLKRLLSEYIRYHHLDRTTELISGGADADLVIDDTLIDIKTGKHLVLDREIFNQLVGYYVLSCIGRVDNCPRGAIKQLAVYYARYGVLHRVKVTDFVVKNRMPAFIKWFKECARQET